VKRFIARYADKIIGTLSGFDRLVFRGHLRRIVYAAGMTLFLNVRRIWFKDFKRFASRTTEALKKASFENVQKLGRPIIPVASSDDDKELIARKIAHKEGIREGLVALLKSTELCKTFGIGSHPVTNVLELRSELSKCTYLYYYFIDPVFGFMNARIQTWFPFNVQICLNGREWLARQMNRAGLAYEQRKNCFTWIEDFEKAQKLMDLQLKANWPSILHRIGRILNPLHDEIFQDFPVDYYWSIYQSEVASDIVFESKAALDKIYPTLVHHAITSFGCTDIMRFLEEKEIHGAFKGQITSDFCERPEGIRVKHWVGPNSLKASTMAGYVGRPEMTMQDVRRFKVFRPKEGDPRGTKDWRPLRKGIADLHRRAQVSQAANERYLDALASVDIREPLGDLLSTVTQPTTYNGKRIRGLRPWSVEDMKLFDAVNRGEFCMNGLRNRDLQGLLFDTPTEDPQEKRRRSSRVSHLLRILRAHGILHKVPKSHFYRVTPKGRDLLTAVLSAHKASLHQLNQLVAAS
jgi:hypothetical protein